MDWSTVVAIYAAFLATILAFREIIISRKRLYGGLRQYRYFDLDNSTPKYFFELSFANKSQRPIQIDSIHLLCGKDDYTLSAEAFNDPKPTMPIYLHESEGKIFSLNIPHLVSWFKLRYPHSKKIAIQVLLITSDGIPCRSKLSSFDVEMYSEIYKDKLIKLVDPQKG